MTEHITACVNCGDELAAEYDAYCSAECKTENESPMPARDCGPTGYQRLRAAEVTGVSVGEQE